MAGETFTPLLLFASLVCKKGVLQNNIVFWKKIINNSALFNLQFDCLIDFQEYSSSQMVSGTPMC